MDPTEIYAAFEELEDEFPNLAELITLPNKTNGYQRRAQATMAGATESGNTPTTALQAGAVVLTSRAWGHEGGNDISAEFRNPGVPNAPLTRDADRQPRRRVARDRRDRGAHEHRPAGRQRDQRERGEPDPRGERLHPRQHNATPPIVPGTGIVQPRARVNLSDFLDHGDERPRPARAVRVLRDADRQEEQAQGGKWKDKGKTARARRSASSCTASSTPASGRRR